MKAIKKKKEMAQITIINDGSDNVYILHFI